jgi:hypothetical protein
VTDLAHRFVLADGDVLVVPHPMTEREFQAWLLEKIAEAVTEDEIGDYNSAVTFEDAGLMTRNAGLVVRLEDGSEFQLSIVQSAGGEA